MQFNGEELRAIDGVEGFVMSIIGESEHKKRAISILNAVLGVLSSSSLIIHGCLCS